MMVWDSHFCQRNIHSPSTWLLPDEEQQLRLILLMEEIRQISRYGKFQISLPFFPVGFHQILQFHGGMNSPRKHWDPISISRPQGADPPYWVQLDMIHSDFSQCFKNTGFNHESRIPGNNRVEFKENIFPTSSIIEKSCQKCVQNYFIYFFWVKTWPF